MILTLGETSLDLSHPHVMGVLNVTPDSFSDGGCFFHVEQALEQAMELASQGASIIDVGGESTRPGANPVTADEEIARVVPVIEAIKSGSSMTVSIDTSKPEVMQAAVDAGADMINDVRALQEAGALEMAAKLDVPICLMHMQGHPDSMQQAPKYKDVVAEVADFFAERIASCEMHGIARDRLILDPGFGFGKSVTHNLQLLNGLEQYLDFGLPILVGLSRKSLFGKILNRAVNERLAGSLAAAVLAVNKGACIVRAHDVHETMDAVTFCHAVMNVNQ